MGKARVLWPVNFLPLWIVRLCFAIISVHSHYKGDNQTGYFKNALRGI